MSHRSWKFRIEDIIEALDRIFHYVKDLNYDAWMKDQKTIDAVIRNLEIIGEAAANVPQEIQDWYRDVSRLKKMAWQAGISLEDGVRETYDWFVNKNEHRGRDSIIIRQR